MKTKTIVGTVIISLLGLQFSFVNQTQSADSNSEFEMAYPENNYDLTYSPVIHADLMTYNMTKPIFDFFNSKGISVSQTYFYNHSATQAYDSETLLDNPVLRNYVLSKQNLNGIYTHSLKMNTALKTPQTLAILNAWKNLMGSYPLIWVDHGGLPQNMDRYGSVPTSQYYINGLRNSSSLKYVWVNYDDSGRILPIPSGYSPSARNSLLGFSSGSYGLVYPNSGIQNLFTSGSRVVLPEFYVPFDYYIEPIANNRGLALEHTYQHLFLYKNINGIKYTKSIPRPSGYSSWSSSWNLHYKDSTNPWMFMPEYATTLNDILDHYTVNSGLGHLLIDRGVTYNDASVYKTGDTIYINTPSLMNNITIYTHNDQTGNALERNGNYYPFTEGYNSWGSTIPSNYGNNSYQLVPFNKYFSDNGQIGRLEYNTDGAIIHFKRTGSLSLELLSSPSSVTNITGNSPVQFTYSEDTITFDGSRNCEYSITYGETPPEPVSHAFTTTSSCHIISSGGTGVDICVYDENGILLGEYGSSCDLIIDANHKIEFGDFTVSPNVEITFEVI